jgi:hypothetical protein
MLTLQRWLLSSQPDLKKKRTRKRQNPNPHKLIITLLHGKYTDWIVQRSNSPSGLEHSPTPPTADGNCLNDLKWVSCQSLVTVESSRVEQSSGRPVLNKSTWFRTAAREVQSVQVQAPKSWVQNLSRGLTVYLPIGLMYLAWSTLPSESIKKSLPLKTDHKSAINHKLQIQQSECHMVTMIVDPTIVG